MAGRTDSRPGAGGCFPRCRDLAPEGIAVLEIGAGQASSANDLRKRPYSSCHAGRIWPEPHALLCSAGHCHEKTVWQRGTGSLASCPAGPAAPRLAPGALAVGRGNRRNQCRWIEARPRGHHPGRRRVVPRAPATSGSQLRRLDSNSYEQHETHAWTRPPARWRRGWRRQRAAASRGRRKRRHTAQPQPRVRQQWSRSPHPRDVAAVVREIPPARSRRDQWRRPGDGGELFPARRALFPHPECDEPGGGAAGSAERPAAGRAPPAVWPGMAGRHRPRARGPRCGPPAWATSERRGKSPSLWRRPRRDQGRVQPRPRLIAPSP